MNKIKIYYLDAFSNQPFKGNPIAVCLIDKDFSIEKMQNIAFELNLSETAFVYPIDQDNSFELSKNFTLKWFTPTAEVNLCGHGTLGTSSLIFNEFLNNNPEIYFKTLSGTHSAKKDNEWIWLNFPLYHAEKYDLPYSLLQALKIDNYINAVISKEAQNLIIEVEDITSVEPDFNELKKISLPSLGGIILTEKGHGKYDFFARYFTPWYGINEDPVTGSAYSMLAPYWSKIINKKEMLAFQASKRGGQIKIKLSDNIHNRVLIGGQTVMIIKGELLV
ncbi:MAG: PhzF family phenazine biosynthesis isomerase [Candidatus Sericytochromatia bacterium]|nr:PhzF family phenazine biosynthesis isomerase [Candidatus Sericytochromatia bacterium]